MPHEPVISPQKHPDPEVMPVDFYTPKFFRTVLTVQERVDCWKNGVALPKAEYCQSWEDVQGWIDLPEEEFMEQYGKDVLALYTFPTPDQLERLEQQQRYHKGKGKGKGNRKKQK